MAVIPAYVLVITDAWCTLKTLSSRRSMHCNDYRLGGYYVEARMQLKSWEWLTGHVFLCALASPGYCTIRNIPWKLGSRLQALLYQQNCLSTAWTCVARNNMPLHLTQGCAYSAPFMKNGFALCFFLSSLHRCKHYLVGRQVSSVEFAHCSVILFQELKNFEYLYFTLFYASPSFMCILRFTFVQ